MALEPNFRYLDDLVPANPAFNDPVNQGDDHLRGIKNSLLANVTGNASETRLVVGGASKVIADASGAQVLGTGLRLINDTTAETASSGRNSVGGWSIRVPPGGNPRLSQLSAAGAIEADWLRFTRNGGIQLLDNDVVKAATAASGNGFDVTGGATQARVFIQTAGGARSGELGFPSSDYLTMRGYIAGGGVAAKYTSPGGSGADRDAFQFDDNSWRLYHLGVLRLQSEGDANVRVRGNATTARLQLANSGNTLLSQLFADGTRSILSAYTGEIRIERTGPQTVLESRSSDGNVAFFSSGVQVARTATEAEGEVDNSRFRINDGSGGGRPVGFNVMPPTTVSTSRDLAGTDNGRALRLTAGDLTAVQLSAGVTIPVINTSNLNNRTISAGTGVTLRLYAGGGISTPSSVTLGPGGVCTIFYADATTVEIWGSELS